MNIIYHKRYSYKLFQAYFYNVKMILPFLVNCEIRPDSDLMDKADRADLADDKLDKDPNLLHNNII